MATAEYFVSSDKAKLNVDLIHDFLSNQTYWAKDRSRQEVEKSIAHSTCFGLYNAEDKQVGFARVITDFTVYAYLMDVFIIELHRGKGLGKLLMSEIVSNEELKKVKKWALATRDAHHLYEHFGFRSVAFPERLMERTTDEIILLSEEDSRVFFEALTDPPIANDDLKNAAEGSTNNGKSKT